jgi:hypothetical protein
MSNRCQPGPPDFSTGGASWIEVGQIGGGSGSVGVFSYGFDIDAVGATSSVPAPASVWLLLTGLAGLSRRRQRAGR